MARLHDCQCLRFAPREGLFITRRDRFVARAQFRLLDAVVFDALEHHRRWLEDVEHEHHGADEQYEELHRDFGDSREQQAQLAARWTSRLSNAAPATGR